MDEILNLIESVSEGFPSYFCHFHFAALLIVDYFLNKSDTSLGGNSFFQEFTPFKFRTINKSRSSL